MVDPQPIAEWLSAANRLTLASPLGWTPAADASGIVPAYPLGLALEGVEVEMFDSRFAGVIDTLRVDPVGRVRNASFLRLRTP